jgi:NADPH:quinone reductase-like Zn-dependent oxidoreductase
MKAATFHSYGSPDVIKISEAAMPKPKENEILVKVHFTTVTSADCRIRAMNIPSKLFLLPAKLVFGFFNPKKQILGTELSGEIVEVGNQVTDFKVANRVVCGTGATLGAHAEYIVVKDTSAIAKLPANVDLKDAACISFGGTTALHYLRNLGKIKPHNKILIYGASGNIGVYAIQLAKYFGAHVTAVCSDKNLDLVKSLGADIAISYQDNLYEEKIKTYDIIFDTVGKINFKDYKKNLNQSGRFLVAVLTATEIWQIIFTSLIGNKKVIGGVAIENKNDLHFLLSLLAENKIKTVIDTTFSFDQIAQAHALVDAGRKRGSVVIAVR